MKHDEIQDAVARVQAQGRDLIAVAGEVIRLHNRVVELEIELEHLRRTTRTPEPNA